MKSHFGGYTLDTDRRELRRGDRTVHLSPKAFQLLGLLASRHPNAISKEDIFAAIWPNTFVSEANLPILIKEIRTALADDANTPRIVRTVFGYGYSLDAEVTVDRESAPRALLHSIAVLPFENQAGPGWEDVSDGISESLINTLARWRRFRVVPRSTAFRHSRAGADPTGIGKELAVDCIVTGRIRVVGEELVAQVELIDIASDAVLWGERFRRRATDFVDLQNEIASEIIARLQSETARPPADAVPTRSGEAYRSFLRGRHYLNRREGRSFQRALESFASAAALDPRFALAHAGAAETYVALGTRDTIPPREIFPQAKAAALRALELDPAIPAAQTALAGVQELFEWDWPAAERSHQRAIALDPQYATAAQWFALHLARRGNDKEAERWMDKAVNLEPASTIINTNAALIAYLAHDFARAIALGSAAIELDPSYEESRLITAIARIQIDTPGAIDELEEMARLAGMNPHVLAHLAYAYGRAGRKSEARQLDRELASSKDYISSTLRAVVALGLDDEEAALDHLDAAAESRSPLLSYVKTDPRFEALRRHRRFRVIVETMGV